ncbi:MAG: SRPBCC family protein [Nocardioides sp.]|nr:SRPBCC family protein [Nocardioides sp.]
MTAPVHVSRSRTFPCGVARAFDTTLAVSLPEILGGRAGLIPGIAEVRGQGDDWGTVGATRTIVLRDRSSSHETLTSVDRPGSFTYRVTGFTGPMKALVETVDGRWTFEKAGTGVRVTWSWDLHPASRVTAPVIPVVLRSWRGWARDALDALEPLLVAPTE